MAAWREVAPELKLVPVPLAASADPDEVAALLLDADLTGATAFVTADARFLNFRRLERMGLFRMRGLPMPPLVCRGAIVSAGAVIGENSYIGAGAIVGQGCKVGFNTVVGAGARLGHGSSIGNSCWIEDGVTVGRGARIGAHVTLGSGVLVGSEVEIGKLCVIDRPGRIDAAVAAKTFLHASHAHPMVIVGA
jgi:carbonic anhydrase/acetyltransferase-like protein (isoleucine patch superfamily)